MVVQNGKRIYADTRPATRDFDDRMADVDWSIVARNKAGVRDRFVMTATNRASGERCRSLRFGSRNPEFRTSQFHQHLAGVLTAKQPPQRLRGAV